MRFYLKDFRIFLSVAETGSLSETAKVMGMSISSVSKRLARLEEHLQTTLFERNTRGVRLTPIGRQAYLKTKEITNVFSKFIDDIRGAKQLTFNIKLDKSILLVPFIDWIYDSAIDSINFRVDVNSTTDLINMPLAINDIAISSVKSSVPSAIHRKLEPIRRVICVSSDYRDNVTIESLSQRKVVFYSENESESSLITNQLSGEKKTLKPALVTNDISLIMRLIDRKGTIAVGIPEYFLKQEKIKKKVNAILPHWSVEKIQHYIIWKERKFYNEEFKKLLHFIEHKFSEFISS
ncbi:LysR family transcriptional regulator [Pantoea dispersa]|uniref:LysR family transcriptional regulator n=1 Tax=Pantoea dispersa TaxID=59814 RepID=UPI0028662BCB|nr:LysR family transcriptional regulator [Pantoea dispersa]MDR6299375.1 DNA-binding transcriptional LysR family regulator [Pantoea dispersa]